MNYKKLETLVLMAKEDNKEAKEEIIAFFRPLILKTCKNTFIPGYDFNDLESECCTILLKAIKLYNPSKQAFAGYAKRAIITNLYYIGRQSKLNEKTNPHVNLTFDGNLEALNLEASDDPQKEIMDKVQKRELIQALQSLNKNERDLILNVFIKNIPLTVYAKNNNLKYAKAYSIKLKSLAKLRNFLK